jgi:hypothetical protein
MARIPINIATGSLQKPEMIVGIDLGTSAGGAFSGANLIELMKIAELNPSPDRIIMLCYTCEL